MATNIDDIMSRIDDIMSDPEKYVQNKTILRAELHGLLLQLQDHTEVKHLIEALTKEYPYIQSKVDIIQSGVKIRELAMELLTKKDVTDDDLKTLKNKQAIYEKAVEINDSLAKQIHQIGGATSEQTEESETGKAQALLKQKTNKE